MDTTQKVVLGVAALTLIIAIILFVFNGKSTSPATAPSQGMPSQGMQGPMGMPSAEGQTPIMPEMPLQPSGVMAMFFADWCGHCKTMMPAWDQFASQFNGYNGVQIIKVHGPDNNELVQMHQVAGFPMIKFCPNGLENPDTCLVYQGERSVNGLAQFLQSVA